MYLRSPEIDRDQEFLYRWENDPDTWCSTGGLNPLSSEFIKQYILLSTTSVLQEAGMNLMIEAIDLEQTVGYLQLSDYNPVSRRVSIGIYIAPEYRRKGYASLAIGLVHTYLQQRLNCRMVYASVLSNNTPSLALFEALGYRHVGTLGDWLWYDGLYWDLKYYQLCLQ